MRQILLSGHSFSDMFSFGSGGSLPYFARYVALLFSHKSRLQMKHCAFAPCLGRDFVRLQLLEHLGLADAVCDKPYVNRTVLKRSALPTTDTELRLMAAAAIIGLRRR